MRRFYLVGFTLLLAFDTLGQVSFKLAANHALPLAADTAWLMRVFTQPWVYGSFVGYIGAFFTWMALLKHAPIGPAFAASHLEVVTVMLASIWLFDEHIGASQIVGGALILAGIACLAIGEARHAPAQDPAAQTDPPAAGPGHADLRA